MSTHTLDLCPFCGNSPSFVGNAGEWQDDHRYVELSIECCVKMTESIWWKRARDMTVEERTQDLKTKLTERWNNRYTGETS